MILGGSYHSFSQTTSDFQEQTYYYSVDHVQSETQLNETFTAFENLKFVTKVKLNYKPEQPSKAQFVIFVKEPKRTSESQQMFEITDLKKIIIEKDLLPTDLKIDNH